MDTGTPSRLRYMGGCQNCDPLVGSLKSRCRMMLRTPQKDHNFDYHLYTMLVTWTFRYLDPLGKKLCRSNLTKIPAFIECRNSCWLNTTPLQATQPSSWQNPSQSPKFNQTKSLASSGHLGQQPRFRTLCARVNTGIKCCLCGVEV